MGAESLPADDVDIAEVEAALADLEPSARAALELSIRHRRPPAELAEITGIDEATLRGWHESALDAVAADLGLSGPDARAEAEGRLEAALLPPKQAPDTAEEGRDRDEEEPEREIDEEPEERDSRVAASRPSRGRRAPVALLVMAALAALLVVLVASSGDDDEGADRVAGSTATAENPSEPPESDAADPPAAISLQALPGAPRGGRVSAAIEGVAGEERLTLTLAGLPAPAGQYRAWLYSSLIDAVPLGSSDSGDGAIEAALPEDAASYEFLDISEQGGGGEAHSGRSIYRVPLAEILAAG